MSQVYDELPPALARFVAEQSVFFVATAPLEPSGHVNSGFCDLARRFPELPGVRSVVRVDLDRVSTSCGYGVPLLRFEGHRDQLVAWAERKGSEGIAAYQVEHNAVSIDGMPGLEPHASPAAAADAADPSSS